ncbi:MAG: M20/M25/M40 family metallo-hydrolase [Alphaproteobacteria bacterium]|nr:MAG: M20/M25/M40 family metallo-hydrolase [Alphaproteobacteria bacterium]
MRLLALSATSLLALALAGCNPVEPKKAADPAPAADAGAVTSTLTTSPEITAADLGARIKELSNDKYEGRGPGTVAGEKAADWIAAEMKRIGLEPGNPDGTYFQVVKMVQQTVDPATSSLKIAGPNNKTWDLKLGPDAVYGTKDQKNATVSFADSDLVFVGYGVVAPEANWNDYGIDVKGKTVVMFVNDPGFITNDATLFNGNAMTYYGRWTYKFEEAARQGATAAILIHEEKPAAYGWNVVEGSWTGVQSDLVRNDGGASRAKLEGWIQLNHATELFKAAGLDIDAQRAAANKRGFRPVQMTGLKASATLNQTIAFKDSRNVIGTVKGSEAPNEHVLLMGHWDHLGKGTSTDPNEDVINNGAVDNATGTAAILEIGEKFAAGPKPKRSVTVLAVTLEESGLLGSAYFGENPIIPLKDIVAGINIDAMQPTGPAKDMVVVGAGASQIEDTLKAVLAESGRVIRPDPSPQNGYFYRSDHISLAKKGVPMLYADSGVDLINGGVAAGEAAGKDYTDNRYHAPADEYADSWDLSGIEADVKVDYEVANRFANNGEWPNWYDGNEFKALRDAQRK